MFEERVHRHAFHARALARRALERLCDDREIVVAQRGMGESHSSRQKAEDLTDRELDLSPARADGWLRLATIGWIKGQSGSQVSAYLDRSYLVGPLDPQIFASRTRFVFDHWNFITQSVREEALAEIRVGWQNWIENATIRNLASQIRNPAGRLAIRLQIAGLSASSGLAAKPN